MLVVAGFAAAALCLRARYGLAPSPRRFDRLARVQACVRVQSMSWLSFVLLISGTALLLATFTAMKVDPERFFRSESVVARLWPLAPAVDLGLVEFGWTHPWDAQVKRLVDP